MPEYKLKITTPKGQAKGSMGKIKVAILGRVKAEECYVNEEDDTIIMVLNTDIRRMLKIQRNANLYDEFVKKFMGNRITKKVLRTKVSEDKRKELEHLLMNETSIEIITPYTDADLQAEHNSYWQKFKSKFKKAEEVKK